MLATPLPLACLVRCERRIVTTHHRLAAALALSFIVLGAPALDAKTIHDDRVRTLDPRLAELLQEGLARSETFRGLVNQLRQGDVVVYVRTKHSRPPCTAACHFCRQFQACATFWSR